MMYLFLAYKDEQQWQVMSPNERDVIESACLANQQELRQSGHLVAIEDLQSSHTTITARVVNGKLSLGDAPVTKTEGQLVELLFINARDLNEAIQVASKMPQTRRGSIEVRPIVEFDRAA